MKRIKDDAIKTEADDQRNKFIATAREIECDEDEDRFNATLKRIAPKAGEPAPEQS